MKSLLFSEFKHIPVDSIVPNPNQPRLIFDEDALSSLSQSIQRHGVITPLTVRRVKGGYELISGERRLRASKMAGLHTVPCYILRTDTRESSFMAVVENIQRRDLDFFEEALSLRCLIEKYGLTQTQAAEQVGKTQSAVANKLRLLRLSPETVGAVREFGLTERHARALLTLPDELQESTARYIGEKKLNVAEAEDYITSLLATDCVADEKTAAECRNFTNSAASSHILSALDENLKVLAQNVENSQLAGPDGQLPSQQPLLRAAIPTEPSNYPLTHLQPPDNAAISPDFTASSGLPASPSATDSSDFLEERGKNRRKRRKPAKNTSFLVKDLRIFLNTVKNAAEIMRKSGFFVDLTESSTDTDLTVTVSLRAPRHP